MTRHAPYRARLLLAAGLALLTAALAACSSSSPGASSPGSPASASASGSPPSAASAATSHYPMKVVQSDGTTVSIPKRPTRIVALDVPTFVLDDLVSLGVTPVGATLFSAPDVGAGTPYDSHGIPVWLSAKVDESAIANVGQPGTPDLEAIIKLHPDLIVDYNGSATRDLKQLEAIAPTVGTYDATLPGTGIDTLGWVPTLTNLARILDLSARAQRVITGFEAAAAPVRKALAGTSASLVTYVGGASCNLVLAGQEPVGAFFTYLGVKIPGPTAGAKVLGTSGTVATLSLENVDQLTAKYLILTSSYGTPGASSFLANAVVQRLAAVKAKRVIYTTAGYGFGSGSAQAGPLGEEAALSALQRAFTDPASTEASDSASSKASGQ